MTSAFKGVDVLFICSYLGKFEASYRRISYFVNYLRSKGLRTACIGTINLTSRGIIRSSEECFSIPLSISSRSITVLPINILLSFFLVLLIIILRPKVIVVSIPSSHLIIASQIGSSLAKAKFIVDIRDPQEEIMTHLYKKGFSGLMAKIYRKISYSIYKRAHIIIGVTRTLATMLAKKIGKPVYLIPNGADLYVFKPASKEEAREKFRLNQESFLVAYIGMLSSYGYYNILPILIAIRKIRKELDIDVKMTIAGPLLDRGIKSVVKGFKDELLYFGILDTTGVTTLLSACDIGVVPRIEDPIYDYAVPAKFYEYIATGLPLIVLANKESEIAKVVENNKLGFVCEPRDQACLENVIRELATDKSLLNRLKMNVLAYRKYVDREEGARKLLKLISKLLMGDLK